jgi:chromosome segregation ATPase
MTVESQRQVIEDLSNRISGLEQDYRQAKILCRSLENENAELRKRLEENARMREARELSFKQTEEDMVNKFDQFKISYSEKLVAAENKAAAELEKALERAHAEAQTKRQAAISSALDAQKMELEGKYKKKILHAENERDELSKRLTKMQKEYDILSIENQNSMKEAQKWMEEAKQKKVLEKEKQALCSVIQDLQNALTRAEEHISRNRNTGRSNNGEKENQMESLSPIKASKHATKGTPLRSLPVN